MLHKEYFENNEEIYWAGRAINIEGNLQNMTIQEIVEIPEQMFEYLALDTVITIGKICDWVIENSHRLSPETSAQLFYDELYQAKLDYKVSTEEGSIKAILAIATAAVISTIVLLGPAEIFIAQLVLKIGQTLSGL